MEKLSTLRLTSIGMAAIGMLPGAIMTLKIQRERSSMLVATAVRDRIGRTIGRRPSV